MLVGGFWLDSSSSCLIVLLVETNISAGSKAMLNRAWHSRNTPTLNAHALRRNTGTKIKHEKKQANLPVSLALTRYRLRQLSTSATKRQKLFESCQK